MKLKQLIDNLTKIYDEHGDLSVNIEIGLRQSDEFDVYFSHTIWGDCVDITTYRDYDY